MPQDLTDQPDVRDPELENPPPRSSGRKTVIWVVIILFVFVLGFLGYRAAHKASPTQQQGQQGGRHGGAGDANRPVPVAVAPVAQRDVPVYLEGLGNVQAYYTVTIHSRVDGQLMQVNFREGQ
jgi:multidrug efflux system membrane fusion protein